MSFMTSHQIRESFLDFFQSKKHQIMPSVSLIPEDPTILFTIAGMVPFKPIFLGQKKSSLKRATSSQKCLRTNDIDNVGRTARHHTFFEMLGNFSFGDYFKKEAIDWGWEYFTKIIGFPENKLYVSVFKDDDESYKLWHSMIGLPESHIVRLGEEDNFWKVGPIGPCGPCSEIYIDLGPERSTIKNGGVGIDDRYLELWNLVFMEFSRNEDGTLIPLPQKNIDTGLGLERIASVLQQAPSDFETDLFLPIIHHTARMAGLKYQEEPKQDTALKVIADHTRALVFLLSDGILPSNEGRGYVLRMLLRRAFRYGKKIGLNEPFLYKIAPKVIEIMKSAYPELLEKEKNIYEMILVEEKRFQETLHLGLTILEEYIKKLKRGNQKSLSGKDAFTLYDTYGFPLEITKDILLENGLQVDEFSYTKYMLEQKERSRQTWSSESMPDKGKDKREKIFQKILLAHGVNKFNGYHQISAKTEVIALIQEDREVDSIPTGERGMVILMETPFYAEKGGQKGDTGVISGIEDDLPLKVKVYDTQSPVEGIILHHVQTEEGILEKKQQVKAQVDNQERIEIAANHTATHLLHFALRENLGEHVKQSGSSVTGEHLRFDFTHYKAISKEELDEIESLINHKIWENHQVRSSILSFKEAKETGVIALFGEKYGDQVRLIDIGGFSRELCGGTHLDQTSMIGLFKIVSEQSIGSGLRRIEAVTRDRAWSVYKRMETELQELEITFDSPQERLLLKAEQIRLENEALKRDYRLLWKKVLEYRIDQIIQNKKIVNGVSIIADIIETKEKKELRDVGDMIKEKLQSGIVILATKTDHEKVNLVTMVTDDLVSKGYDAGQIIRPLANAIDGHGGGKKTFAQAGGNDYQKVVNLIKNIKDYLKI